MPEVAELVSGSRTFKVEGDKVTVQEVVEVTHDKTLLRQAIDSKQAELDKLKELMNQFPK